MSAECTCAIPDSFNVRPSDLVNPRCPIHGAGHLPDLDKATFDELCSVILEDMHEVKMLDHTILVMDFPFGPADLARKLLNRYDIRRKRER